MNDPAVDPMLEELARSLRDRVDRSAGRSVLVGIAGSVAAGKSTTAAHLAALVDRRVEVVPTDSFLLPNEQLAPLGGALRKGYPESYDWPALDGFLRDARAGRSPLSTPIYSHEHFDIVAGRLRTFESPELLIVEGLNLLQPAPPTSGVTTAVAAHLDLSIYLDAAEELLEQWFVERFVALSRPTATEPSDFYRQFADLDDAALEATANWVWNEINAPNLHAHIRPSRDRADVVLQKGPGHRIERVERRR